MSNWTARRARRCITCSDASSLDFTRFAGLAAQQRCGPVLSFSSRTAQPSTALLLSSTKPAVSERVFHAHLMRAVAGLAGVVAVLIAIAMLAIRLLQGRGVPALAAWLAVEAAFWVWFRHHAATLDAQPVPHKPRTNDPILHFRRLVEHAKFYRTRKNMDWRAYVSKWFKDTPADRVRVGNLEDMLCYGFFYSTRHSLQAEGRWHLVQAMARQLGVLAAAPKAPPSAAAAAGPNGYHDPTTTRGAPEPAAAPHTDSGVAPYEGEGDDAGCIQLAEGYEPGLSFMAHLWEPLNYHHRPLVFYLIIELLHWVTWGALTALGLRYTTVQGTTFYYTPGMKHREMGQDQNQGQGGVTGKQAAAAAGVPSGTQDVPPPLVFLHGVGLGLLPYLLVVVRLVASGFPLLMPEVRHVSMRLCDRVPPACEVAQRVVAAMDHMGITQACVLAHSYGTFVSSRIVQSFPSRVHSLSLIDPVCFGMFLPSLLRNFIYRTPWDAYREGGWRKVLRCLPVYFVSRELHAATAFCRKFFWTDVNLWAEELPPRSLVVLAGADELLHADEVRQVVSGAYRGVPRPVEPLGPEALLGSPNTMSKVSSFSGSKVGTSSSGSKVGISAFEAMATTNSSVGSLAAPAAPGAAVGACSPSQARVLYHPTAGHADWLLDNAWQAEVVEQVLSLARGEDVVSHVTRRATAWPASALVPGGTLAAPPPRGAIVGSAGNVSVSGVVSRRSSHTYTSGGAPSFDPWGLNPNSLSVPEGVQHLTATQAAQGKPPLAPVKRANTTSSVIQRRMTLSAPPGWPALAAPAAGTNLTLAYPTLACSATQVDGGPIMPLIPSIMEQPSGLSSGTSGTRGTTADPDEACDDGKGLEDVACELRQMIRDAAATTTTTAATT